MTDTILRKPDVKRITGFSDVTIRGLEKAGNFPKRFKLNPDGKHVGWLESEVQTWMQRRAESRQAA